MTLPMRQPRRRSRGFTLIEMIVVMAAIGLLLSLAVPRYMDALERGKEQVLQHNLNTMREALDKFYGDNGKYPDKLEDLVTRRYLRAIPVDPFAESPTWIIVAPRDPARGGVIDVRSTLSDATGQPRSKRDSAPSPAPVEAAPGFADQEAGSTQIVTVGPIAVSMDDAKQP